MKNRERVLLWVLALVLSYGWFREHTYFTGMTEQAEKILGALHECANYSTELCLEICRQ